MSNIIIIAILVVAIVLGIKESVKHFKGEGGCCGGGSTVKPKRKKLKGEIVYRKTFKIEGMHCENCSNRIEGKINDMDGVSCVVNLKKKEAVVTATLNIENEQIVEVIRKLGYDISM